MEGGEATFRNLCSRKVNQFVSIFSATDSVLDTEVKGQSKTFAEQ